MINITAIKDVRPETPEAAKAFMDGYREARSLREYSKQLGIPSTTGQRWFKHCENILNGFQNVPEGHFVKGVSVLEDADGNVKQRWVKTNNDAEDIADKLERVIGGLIDGIRPTKAVQCAQICDDDLLTAYIVSDFHLGQYSSLSEVGEAWDLGIAYDTLCGFIDLAVKRAPNSHTALLVDLGDFLHADGILPLTPASKHVLDASGRFHEVIDIAISLFDYMIEKLLQNHKFVHVIIAEGNHNESSYKWMRRAVERKYINEPRLSFDKTEHPYYAYNWGKNALFFHHGHKKKIADIAPVFVAEYRDMYGQTDWAYCHMGHLHHIDGKESNMMRVKQHSTLAAKDAHSKRHGYHSMRGALVTTYHKIYGQQEEQTITPRMIHDNNSQ